MLCSVPIRVAFKALGDLAVPVKDFIVVELATKQEALVYKQVSLLRLYKPNIKGSYFLIILQGLIGLFYSYNSYPALEL